MSDERCKHEGESVLARGERACVLCGLAWNEQRFLKTGLMHPYRDVRGDPAFEGKVPPMPEAEPVVRAEDVPELVRAYETAHAIESAHAAHTAAHKPKTKQHA